LIDRTNEIHDDPDTMTRPEPLPPLHTTTKIFTPTSVATHTFVERLSINRRLVNALMTPGMQIVVFGRSGCGKSTLLTNKLRQVYESHVTSRCMATTTVDDLIRDAFDQLAPFYVDTKERRSKRSRSASLVAAYGEVKAALAVASEHEEKVAEKRMLPPQLSPSLLARLLGAVRACWVVEDFHKVGETEKARLAQVMKLFVDTATEYETTKIVAIGAAATARQIVRCDPEMMSRVAEIDVPLMGPEELDELMGKGCECLNLEIPIALRRQIRHMCNGLPSVCHQLCLNMCFDREVYETAQKRVVFSLNDLLSAIESWIEDSADTLQDSYDRATRALRIKVFDNCRIILHALAELPPQGGTHSELYRKVRETQPSYPAGNLTKYLRQLHSDERDFVLARDEGSGRFSFASPMMHAYVRGVLSRAEHRKQTESMEAAAELGQQLEQRRLEARLRFEEVFNNLATIAWETHYRRRLSPGEQLSLPGIWPSDE
jgi:hypothetical protein